MLTTMFAVLGAAALAQDAPPAAAVSQPDDAPVEAVRAVRAVPDEVAFRITVLPGMGMNAAPDARVDGFSTGFVGQARQVDGIDGQLGVSVVAGRVDGVQASGLLSMAEEVDGVQLSATANLVEGDVEMMQLSGAVNSAGGDVLGLQGAGAVNLAGGEVVGVQAAGAVNIAEAVDGIQAAPLNITDRAKGVQAGVVNVGGDVDGLQLGVVNVARTSKVSIAPLNFIGDGLHRVDVWASESAVVSGGVKFGSRHVYTLLAAGWVGQDQPWWTFGGGFGVHLQRDRLWAEVDDSVWGVASGNVLAPGVHNKLRLQVGVDLVDRHVAPFAGVSVNTWFGTGQITPRARDLPSRLAEGGRVVTWPGIHAGISF